MDCGCYRCTNERVEREPHKPDPELGIMGMIDVRLARMFLCETCGNKRCPHAADHRNTCTNSNAPGQKGSLYEDAPIPPCDSDRNPEGEKPKALSAKHESAGPKDIAQPEVHP